MKSIEAAFTGIIPRDAELRTARSGRQWLSFSVIVGEEPDEQWVSVAAFSGSIAELAPQLTKGTRVYAEGRLKLRSWESEGGTRFGLSVAASLVQPMALIGQRRPKKPRPKLTEKIDPQAPIEFADGTSQGKGDALPF